MNTIPSLTLNIGLRIGRSAHLNTVTQTVQALERAGFNLQALRVDQSSTEPTVVVQVESASTWGVHHHQAAALHGVAVVLGQQAIAAFEPNRGHGVLVGPEAAAWGEFDPTEFIGITGRRLVPKAAGSWGSGVTRDQSEDRAQPYTLAQLAALGASRA
jgi:hypothetical protein